MKPYYPNKRTLADNGKFILNCRIIYTKILLILIITYFRQLKLNILV